MSYVENTLIAGERLIYEGRLSLWSLQTPLCFGLFSIWGSWLTSGAVHSAITWGSFLAGLFAWIWAWCKFATTEAAITTRRVVHKRGLIARYTEEIEIGRIEGLAVEQTAAQRLMGFGTVLVSGVGSHRAIISSLADPIAFSEAFREALQIHAGAGTGAGAKTDRSQP